MKALTVGQLVGYLAELDPSAEVSATDQWGATESPVVSIQVRRGVVTTVILDFELPDE